MLSVPDAELEASQGLRSDYLSERPDGSLTSGRPAPDHRVAMMTTRPCRPRAGRDPRRRRWGAAAVAALAVLVSGCQTPIVNTEDGRKPIILAVSDSWVRSHQDDVTGFLGVDATTLRFDAPDTDTVPHVTTTRATQALGEVPVLDASLSLLSLGTGRIYDLHPAPAQQGFPSISGRRLVWQDATYGGDDVFTAAIPGGL
jgi:hypothetical protein